ncbi:MAG: nucleotide-binding protein [Myxococcales bacterium]|nr:nucleotide-binding protein [Myxococcales bacterium]
MAVDMKMSWVLGAVIVAAGGYAVFGESFRRDRPMPEPTSARPAAPLPDLDQAPAASGLIEGTALEVLDVPGYSYIRVGPAGSEGQWVAVTTANVKTGALVRVRSDTVMTDFESKTLGRVFASIHFGSLVDGKAAGPLPPGHPPADPALPPGHPPAGVKPAPAPSVATGKATGANARTIVEIFSQKQALAGKKVRVHGTVVKLTSGIMGKTFLHLRDGTGSEAAKNHDLTVTTTEELARDQSVTLEGTLVLDKDLGAGYRYDALLEDAVSVK